MPTERHAVGMAAAIRQRQPNRRLDLRGGVLSMQAEDAYELAHAVAVRPLSAQAGHPRLIDGGPALAPATERLSVLEGARPLLQHGQVVQRSQESLLAARAAGMAGQHPVQR